jgi:hypothetical protein
MQCHWTDVPAASPIVKMKVPFYYNWICELVAHWRCYFQVFVSQHPIMTARAQEFEFVQQSIQYAKDCDTSVQIDALRILPSSGSFLNDVLDAAQWIAAW